MEFKQKITNEGDDKNITPRVLASIKINRPQRSPPIPKEVNSYILSNYGSSYYNSQDCSERSQILKQIEEKLKVAGYNITWLEVERRLKNMKSHYRLKKKDLELGLITSVEWEYFVALDEIFKESENEIIEKPKVEVAQKRKIEVEVKSEDELKPQDLSLKRPKLIEFFHVSDLTRQIPVQPTPPPAQPTDTEELIMRQAALLKIVEGIKSVDEQRLLLDQQRINMEIRRYELDVIGYKLSEVLNQLMQAFVPSTN